MNISCDTALGAGAEPLLFTQKRSLVLASASPRRHAFLQQLGLSFTVSVPEAGVEPAPKAGEDPLEFVQRAARAKADAVMLAVKEKQDPPVVLAADTIVVCDTFILGKPKDSIEAFAFLQRLAGREHRVSTACCLALPDGRYDMFTVTAGVYMPLWPDAVLRAYASCGEPLDKAGAYAVQGRGAFLVERVRGSWSAVVGLPLAELVTALLRQGCICCLE